MSKGDKNRTVKREDYRKNLDRIIRNEKKKKKNVRS